MHEIGTKPSASGVNQSGDGFQARSSESRVSKQQHVTRVLLLSKYDGMAASVRQRFMLYAPLLREHGIELHISPLFDDDYLKHRFTTGRVSFRSVLRCYHRRVKALLSANKFDLAIIHYDAMPYFPAMIEALLMRSKIKYVYDFDDAAFHQYDKNRNPVVRLCLGNKIAKVIKSAAYVFAGSEYLAEYAKRTNDNVAVVPTVVDTNRFPLKPHIQSDGPLALGWIGSPSSTAYLKEVFPTIERLAQQRPVKVIVIGATQFDVNGCDVEFRDWSEETEISDLLECDIGIMPLSDVPWARGKCAFKLIQYMACGLPVVASPVGANIGLVGEDVGILADSHEAWLKAFTRLANDAQLRQRMGLAGRKVVEREFSLRATGPVVLKTLQGLMANGETTQ